MSVKAPHFIPHPLTSNDNKIKGIYLRQLGSDWETLDNYIKESPNPKWAASHLVRAIANGLMETDNELYNELQEFANKLASSKG